MKWPAGFERRLNRISGLWIVFGLILSIVAIGLGLLSRHALQLQEQQTTAQQREQLQQNVRVALWRIDSRLAPYIATIHQQRLFNSGDPSKDQFIQQRFQITRESGTKSARMVYLPVPLPSSDGAVDSIERRSQVDALLSAVSELVPDRIETIPIRRTANGKRVSQSKTQQYTASAQRQQALSAKRASESGRRCTTASCHEQQPRSSHRCRCVGSANVVRLDRRSTCRGKIETR